MRQNREEGQALITVVLTLAVLLGFCGLAIDMGMMRFQKRIQQTAADAAALAGATNLGFGSVTAGAQSAAAANGFTDNTGGVLSSCTSPGAAVGNVCVVVNNPPSTGPQTGKSNYVEGLVSVVQPTYFMKVFNVNSTPITARAVAAKFSPTNSDCLYLMGGGLTVSGGGSKGGLIAPSCGIVINGGFSTTGKFPVCAGSVGLSGSGAGGGSRGSCSASNPGSGTTCNDQSVSACPASIPATGNPLALLTIPAQPSPKSCSGNCFNPGTYTSPISISGGGSYVFNPGIYVLNGGGLLCSGTPTITGTGVMFYLENGAAFNCAGNASVSLTGPSATNCPSCPSQVDGILMYQNPTDQSLDDLSGGGNSAPDEGYYGLIVLWGLSMNGNDLAILGGASGLGTPGYESANATLVE
jgi:Putative Flp pilus-assembly TadE/G-like